MNHPSGVPKDLPFHLIEEITNGFSPERTLGSGAFGKVYKGEYKSGEVIAVKVLFDMPGLDDEQFLNEFDKLNRLQHQNIVQLVGYCHETRKKYVEYNGRLVFAEKINRALCLEYMHNGSLDKHISDENHGHDWHTRYAIIKGICMGLKYLHEELESPIYHLDLKPGNILLDENMSPKIADFGLSKLFGEEKTRITKSSIGTHGYLPPEYIERNIVSNKLDIFSLGVILIKIMTGRTGHSKSVDMSSRQFIQLVHHNWRQKLQETSAYNILESYLEQVRTCIEIAMCCVDADRHKRPTIGEIVQKLNDIETMIPRLSLLISYSPSRIHLESSMNVDKDTQRCLQDIVLDFCETWNYAIFWHYVEDVTTGAPFLHWGAGYFHGCDEEKRNFRVTTPVERSEQEHRKRVMRQLSEIVDGRVDEQTVEEDVTDLEYFFIKSMTKKFDKHLGLPGKAFFTTQPIWITTGLSIAPCDRALEAYTIGIRTMVYVPIDTGVIELGSTHIISQSADSVAKIIRPFSFTEMDLTLNEDINYLSGQYTHGISKTQNF